MDGRRSLLLGIVVAAGVAGCTHETIPLAPGTPIPATAKIEKESDLPKRKPQAATCVAFGNFREQEALAPERSPLEQQQLREQARKAYQQALEIDPNHLQASQSLARLYVAMNDFDHAFATYEKALRLHPKEPALWYDAGMCYGKHKDRQRAVENLQKANELDPENRQYANALGYALARGGRFDESLACFQKIVGPAQAHYNLARMHHHLKQDDLSKQHLKQALQADPQFRSAADMLVQLETGKVDGSKTILNVGFESAN